MSDERERKRRRGRRASTTAILDAARELFSERGYSAASVRDIAERAGVTHALVHQYVGGKAEVFRAVLKSGEGVLASAAPDTAGLAESVRRMLRRGLDEPSRSYARMLVGSALGGLPYDRAAGRFTVIERLIELAEQQAGSASKAERAERDLDPRLVVACVGSLFLGWVAVEPWMRPAAGLQEMDEAELADGLERVLLSILKDHVPGAEPGTSAA
jgi:TetR/AcrR family transcriptional regulator, repressor for neighboring sulfatase